MKVNNQITLASNTVSFCMQKDTKKEDKNKYHQYPIKYLAYTNDFGIALRPIIGNKFSLASWIPTISYVFFAANYSSKNTKNNQNQKENFRKELCFQCIANLALPFLLIETTKFLTEKIIQNKTKKLTKFNKDLLVSGINILILLSSVKKMDEISHNITNYFFSKQKNNHDKINNNKELIGEKFD